MVSEKMAARVKSYNHVNCVLPTSPCSFHVQARVSNGHSHFFHTSLALETQLKSENSLFEKNLTPGISSRLPLNTASVFYFGVIGKGKRSEEQEIMQVPFRPEQS